MKQDPSVEDVRHYLQKFSAYAGNFPARIYQGRMQPMSACTIDNLPPDINAKRVMERLEQDMADKYPTGNPFEWSFKASEVTEGRNAMHIRFKNAVKDAPIRLLCASHFRFELKLSGHDPDGARMSFTPVLSDGPQRNMRGGTPPPSGPR